MKYFIGELDGAIKDYMEAYNKIIDQYKGYEMPEIEKERCAYLINSIAWTYKRRNQDGDNKKAIEWYQRLFNRFENIENYVFSWRYIRNYGVCLENAKEYVNALEQYKKVLDNYAQAERKGDNNEYKIFLTYCSATMKYWDNITEKTSGSWIEKTREIYKQKNKYFNDEIFININAYLTHANEKYTKVCAGDGLPDYYNQLSKMLTYKMIISSSNDVSKRDTEEIKKKLKIVESIDKNAIGYHFIKRDFYYALYELVHDEETKKDSLEIAWNENELLKGKGDSKKFSEMLEGKRKNKEIN